MVLPDEDAAAFAVWCDDLWAEYDPDGPRQEVLVDIVATSFWRLRRCRRMEVSVVAYLEAANRVRWAEHGDQEVRGLIRSPPDPTEEHSIVWLDRVRDAENDRDAEALGAAFIADADTSNAFSKLSRYETTSVLRR